MWIISNTLITKFMGPTWGPSETDRAQVGPMLAPWTLLSGKHKNSLSLNITHWGQDKSVAILQMTVWNTFSWKNIWIFLKVSLKFVLKVGIDIPPLVKIMAWCPPGDKPLSRPVVQIIPWRWPDNKPLSAPMMVYLTEAYKRHLASVIW